MKELIPIVGMLTLAVVAAKAQDPAKVDSEHYKVLLDNEYVRVLDVHHKPAEKSPMHSHPNHVVYSFTDSTVRFTSSNGKTGIAVKNQGRGRHWQYRKLTSAHNAKQH